MAAPTAPRRRAVPVLAVLAVLLVALGPVPAPAGGAVRSAADCTTGEGEVSTGSVLVQVVFPSGTFTRCVDPGGSGLDVLHRSGLAIEVQTFGGKGGAVCGITDPEGTFVGCADGSECLTCPASDSGTRYWGYFRCYAYSPVGAGSTTPAGGTIESWRYGGSGAWSADRPADCDDGRAESPTTTAAAPTTTPATDPAGGGGSGATTTGSDDSTSGGATTPDGSTTDPDDTATTTTTTTATDGAPGETTTTTSPTEDEHRVSADRDGSWDPVDGDEERAEGVPAAARSGAGGGGGVPVVALIVTALVVAAVAALAIRARRNRTPDPATPAT